MSHSIPARRKEAIEARNYEVALSSLVAEQKDRTALASLSGEFDLVRAELEICEKLEKYRRDLLEGFKDNLSPDGYLIDTLVRARIPTCPCQPFNFRPGEYCAECGVYRADGDEF
mgnify:CR=1 FL=1